MLDVLCLALRFFLVDIDQYDPARQIAYRERIGYGSAYESRSDYCNLAIVDRRVKMLVLFVHKP